MFANDSFIGQIIITIIGGVLVAIIIALGTYFRPKMKPFVYNIFRKSVKKRRVYKRIREAKVITFFYNRAILRTDAGTVRDYIERATNEVYLIGCWLSTTLNDEDLKNVIIEQIDKGVAFYFCFSGWEDSALTMYSRYFNMSREDVIESLYSSYDMLLSIRESLPIELRKNLNILYHNQLVVTALWAADPKSQNALYKLDHRVIRGDVKSAYGFEFYSSPKCQFDDTIWKGYKEVLLSATPIYEMPDGIKTLRN